MAYLPLAQALKPDSSLKKRPSEIGSLTKSENVFLDSLGAPKLKNCADDVIKQALKLGMILLGIRENNMPIEIEKVLLVNACRDNHGNLTIKELKLAFEMAANLELDFDPNSYQNFSVLYLNQLLQAYKNWSGNAYKSLKPDQSRDDEKENPTWSPMVMERRSVNQHRADILMGQENYRNGILSQSMYIPYEWYRVLCEDGILELDEDAIIYANKKCSELTVVEKAKLKKGQEYVWELFEASGRNNLYANQPDSANGL